MPRYASLLAHGVQASVADVKRRAAAIGVLLPRANDAVSVPFLPAIASKTVSSHLTSPVSATISTVQARELRRHLVAFD